MNALLEKLIALYPQFDPTWTAEVSGKWFDGFGRLLDMISAAPTTPLAAPAPAVVVDAEQELPVQPVCSAPYPVEYKTLQPTPPPATTAAKRQSTRKTDTAVADEARRRYAAGEKPADIVKALGIATSTFYGLVKGVERRQPEPGGFPAHVAALDHGGNGHGAA